MDRKEEIAELLAEYKRLGIASQVDYEKFYLYSIITHSTAIEGSTVTEIENQLLFDEGIAVRGRSMTEQLMNIDLKNAYESAFVMAKSHRDVTVGVLKSLSAMVLKNTGTVYNTLGGTFDSSRGDLRLVNVTAGAGGRSYMNYLKVPSRLHDFCKWLNEGRERLLANPDVYECYAFSFEAHLRLVTIHPWVDGNGRMSRLLMNMLQVEFGLIPTKVLSEEKAEYIQALVCARDEELVEPFVRFMFDAFARCLSSEMELFKSNLNDEAAFDKNDGGQKTIDDGGQKTTNAVDRKQLTGGQKTRASIMDMMQADSGISSTAIARRLGINRSAVSKHIKILQDEGLVRRDGPAKGGKWIVLNR